MLAKMANMCDPWRQTIGLLSLMSGRVDPAVTRLAALHVQFERRNCRLPMAGERFDAQVCLIERPTSATATIAWRDATHCSYGDQLWHAARARVNGVCAMSGRAIQVGDAVFKPRRGRPAPLNASAMILATVLNDAPHSGVQARFTSA
ncbi:DUF3331 domain-containing protein [Paraburkholderia rhizosphaerae]|uniref:Uncharacterized protein DUF3331 n=1 Tax=Paraburkholderia rhizosphaerae TaxID=480658 RepID=A0A4R8LMH0_9BURK|nr:DUF3331 domain-containing protein [Paraburkholderia rhizosphaerae]TDY46541.1 uncharacterized protein DUF3331 [Paraburkholderia rhizosphaerae]